MFTMITVTGLFTRPDGSAETGTVTATLSHQIENGGVIVDPTPVVGELNGTGALKTLAGAPLLLAANDDPGTVPPGSSYLFTVMLGSTPAREFRAVLSHSVLGGTVDLSVLEPSV